MSASRKRRVGLTRLARYVRGHRTRVGLLAMVGVGSAAAPVAALFVVQDAINEGMLKHDNARLTEAVVLYVAINAAAWILSTTLVRGLARVGQDVVLGLRRDLFEHLTTLSLRYFSVNVLTTSVVSPCERTSDSASTSDVSRAMIQPAFWPLK